MKTSWPFESPAERQFAGFGFANAEGVPITSGELVAASQTREFTAAGLGYATGMSYLNVTGADGTGAKWRVELQ